MKRLPLLLAALLITGLAGCNQFTSAVLYRNGHYTVQPRSSWFAGARNYFVVCNGSEVLGTDDYDFAKMMADRFAKDATAPTN